MRITEQKIANIVREEVSRFKAEENYFNTPNQIFLLKEGKLITKSFNELLREVKVAKPKQQEKLCEIWYQSSLYEIKLHEGVIDALGKAGKWVGDKMAAAWEKVSDFFGMKYLQAVELLKSGAKGAIQSVKLIKVLGQKMEAFRKKHPVIFKVTVAVGTIIVISAFMAIFSSDANAAIRDQSGKPMDQFHVDLLKGAAVEMTKSLKGTEVGDAVFHSSADMMELLDKMHKSKETVDFDTIGKISKAAGKILKIAEDTFQQGLKEYGDARDIGDKDLAQEVGKSLNHLAEIGKDAKGEFVKFGNTLSSIISTSGNKTKLTTQIVGGGL